MWNDLCTPAQIYAIFAFVYIIWSIIMKQYKSVVGQAFFAIIWTIVLGWICNLGYTGLSWFLLITPIVFTLLMLAITLFTFYKLGTSLADKIKEDSKK